LDLATEGMYNAQDVFEAQGRLARLQLNDKAHANACSKRKLGLSERQLLSGVTHGVAKLRW
jgi:hypothetical protein